MGSVSTIYNGVRTWLAGRALMDVAFSDRSTNGVQNKVIKAKFDELNSDISALFINTVVDSSTIEVPSKGDGIVTLTYNIPAGYEFFVYIPSDNTLSQHLFNTVARCDVSNNVLTVTIAIYNNHTAALNTHVYGHVICIKKFN